MSIKNIKNSGFCALPFIEKYKNSNRTDNFYCCWSNKPIGNRATELQTIYNGGRIDQCSNCYKLEEDGVISPRERETVRWFKDADVRRYLENWSIEGEQLVFFYDLRYSNKCNLACISCNPSDSSLWAKELNVKVSRQSMTTSSVANIVKSKKIYMAGGEPFLIAEFIEIIKLVAEQEHQPEIVINTNLTTINDDLKYYLSKIKKLNLVISVDSYGTVNEYHRWPLSWDKFLTNLEFVSDLNCYKTFNSVIDSISVLDIGALTQLEQHIDRWSLTILESPSALRLAALPEKFKSIAIESVTNLRTSKFYTSDPEFRKKADHILTLCTGASEDSTALVEYIKTLDNRRKLQHEHYLGVKLF